MKEKAVITFNRHGESGNIHWIFAKLIEIFGNDKFNEIFKNIKEKGMDYEQALDYIGKYVTLIDNPTAR